MVLVAKHRIGEIVVLVVGGKKTPGRAEGNGGVVLPGEAGQVRYVVHTVGVGGGLGQGCGERVGRFVRAAAVIGNSVQLDGVGFGRRDGRVELVPEAVGGLNGEGLGFVLGRKPV